ncbi:hypothetical protein HZ320_04755 [[Pasteurella] aerogenes]|nr:hypothetical protein HZ320_04755 [[Pasteurella] aerogenes]
MKKSFLFITSALFSAYSILAQANTVHSVHVSEAGVSENTYSTSQKNRNNPSNTANQNIDKSNRTYLSKETTHKLNPQNAEDANQLAKSIENEYYGSISGATVYSQNAPQNMQYAPVFNIQDPELAKKIQDEQRKLGRKNAGKNIKQNSEMLSNSICK